MHIPDGFISGPVILTGWAVAGTTVAVSLRKLNKTLRDEQIPILGVTAAFVFAAQLVNFPIVAGTSGHFLGAVLAALLLGPWAACLVMTLVLAVQCLIFADGGVTALGVNIINMGIIAGMGGYCIFSLLSRIFGSSVRGFYVSVGIASWISIVAASAAAAVELGVSGTMPTFMALLTMAGFHSLIGVGEALITVGTISVVQAARPDLLNQVRIPKEAA